MGWLIGNLARLEAITVIIKREKYIGVVSGEYDRGNHIIQSGFLNMGMGMVARFRVASIVPTEYFEEG